MDVVVEQVVSVEVTSVLDVVLHDVVTLVVVLQVVSVEVTSVLVVVVQVVFMDVEVEHV
jgi:hypothetical protein